jgi:hypothetical protein
VVGADSIDEYMREDHEMNEEDFPEIRTGQF